MADELRPGARPWFPRSSRNFSLGNITEDVTDWYYQSQNAAEERARQQAADAITPKLDVKEDDARYRVNPRRNPAGYIQAAIQDAAVKEPRDFDSLDTRERVREMQGRIGGNPFQRPKMENARHAGQQQAYLMEQMLAAYGKPVNGMFPSSWRQLPDELAMDMYAYATNSGGYRDRLNTSTEYTGVLGESSPVNTALTWGQSTPAMIYATGENLGNAVDYATSYLLGGQPATQYPDAGKNFQRSLNTFSAPGQALAEGIGYAPPIEKGHSAWSDMKDAREALDKQTKWDLMGYAPSPYGTTPYEAMQYGNLSQEAQAGAQQEGREYLEGQRVPSWLAAPAGMLLDDLFSPVFDAPGIAAASKTGRLLPLAKQLGIEFAPGQAMAAVGVAGQIRARQLEEQAKQDALIERLR